MIDVQEFVLELRVEQARVDGWIEAGWLLPLREPQTLFSDVDVARGRLIRELQEDFGVNDEGVSLILHLLDQMHGLRAGMRDMLGELGEMRRSRPGSGQGAAE